MYQLDILFEEYKSAVKSYDSMQDSLDRAYLAIFFGEIAFFVLHICSTDRWWINAIPLIYMAIGLAMVLGSFVLSKMVMAKLKELKGLQINLLTPSDRQDFNQTASDVLEEQLGKVIFEERQWIDTMSVRIRQLNWHVPIIILFSSALCFNKVSFIETKQFDIMCWLILPYLILTGVTYFLIQRRRK